MNRNIHVPFLGEERAVTFFSLPDPRTGPKQAKRVKGFQTGDLVRAFVTSGTKQGTYVGRVAVRTRGSFAIKTARGTVPDIHHRFCSVVARSDGYTYAMRKEAALPPTA